MTRLLAWATGSSIGFLGLLRHPLALDPGDAVVSCFAVGRAVLLAVAGYLVVVSGLQLLAAAVASPTLRAATDRMTVPAYRRLLGRSVGIGLTASLATVALPAGAGEGESLGQPTPEPAEATPSVPGTAVLRPIAPPPVAVARSLDPAPPEHWTIAPGDHLWSVAEESLRDAWETEPTDDEIAPYWRALIEQNRDVLVDPDNPDLVYAGQVFVLPPAPDR